jgi:hypothetical protein
MNGNDKGDKGKGNRNKKCRYAPCGMIGHIKDDCIKKLKATIEKLGHPKDGKTSSSSITANTATMSNTSSNNYDDAIQLFIAKQSNKTETNEWAVDSGATEHMSPNRDWFISYHLLPVHKKVRLGDGSIIHAIAIGHVPMDFNLDSTT